MIVAFACIRTSIMYKCSKFGVSLESARNVKSQHKRTCKLNRLCKKNTNMAAIIEKKSKTITPVRLKIQSEALS